MELKGPGTGELTRAMGGFSGYILSQWLIRKSECGAGKQCVMNLLRNRMKNHVGVCCRAGLQQRTCL